MINAQNSWCDENWIESCREYFQKISDTYEDEWRRQRDNLIASVRALSFEGRDLRLANFAYADLYGADFTDASLDGASFFGARAESADFHQSSALGADFRHANLIDADFGEADLTFAYFDMADLRDANFGSATLVGTMFGHADLRHADFLASDLLATDMRYTDLRDAHLFTTRRSSILFHSADLRNLRGNSPPSLLRSSVGDDRTLLDVSAGANTFVQSCWRELPEFWDTLVEAQIRRSVSLARTYESLDNSTMIRVFICGHDEVPMRTGTPWSFEEDPPFFDDPDWTGRPRGPVAD